MRRVAKILKIVRCIVVCNDESGLPCIIRLIVTTTDQDYRYYAHITAIETYLEDKGYATPASIFVEHDHLFNQFVDGKRVWENAVEIEAQVAVETYVACAKI